MSVLWEEDGKHARSAGDILLGCHTGQLGDVLLGIVFALGQFFTRSVSIGLAAREWNLDVDHLVMSFEHSLLLALSHGNIHKEVVTLNHVLALGESVEVVIGDKCQYIFK